MKKYNYKMWEKIVKEDKKFVIIYKYKIKFKL